MSGRRSFGYAKTLPQCRPVEKIDHRSGNHFHLDIKAVNQAALLDAIMQRENKKFSKNEFKPLLPKDKKAFAVTIENLERRDVLLTEDFTTFSLNPKKESEVKEYLQAVQSSRSQEFLEAQQRLKSWLPDERQQEKPEPERTPRIGGISIAR
jgi:hypothetical protein